MKFILDNEIGRRSPRTPEEPVGVLVADDLRELVSRSNQQRRPVIVYVFVDGEHRQRPAHHALAVQAFNLDGRGLALARPIQLMAAGRAVSQLLRRRPVCRSLQGDKRIPPVVGSRAAANPQANRERLAPLKLHACR